MALVEDSASPINAVNSYLYFYRLDEASFPAGSTADLVLNTSGTLTDQAGGCAIYSGVASGAPDNTVGTDTNNNSTTYSCATTPGDNTGVAVGVCGYQDDSGSHSDTGDLTEIAGTEIVAGFTQDFVMCDELDPAASSRTHSGSWGANPRDLSAAVMAWSGDDTGGATAILPVPTLVQNYRNMGILS